MCLYMLGDSPAGPLYYPRLRLRKRLFSQSNSLIRDCLPKPELNLHVLGDGLTSS